MKTFFAAALVGVASAELLSAEFIQFVNYVARYNKTYDTVDSFNFRKEQWMKTHAFIEENNNSGT